MSSTTEDLVRTPQPWPDAAMPSATQLADWLGDCTDFERWEVACRIVKGNVGGSWIWLGNQQAGSPIYDSLTAERADDSWAERLYNSKLT